MLPAIIIAIIGGASATYQTSVNGKTGEVLRSPYLATGVSNFVAFLILVVASLIVEGDLRIPFSDINTYPAWIWLGGVCGTIVVLMGIICLPVLGSARNIMLVCTGQLLMGLAVDHFGLFDAAVKPMTLPRFAGALLVLGGIFLVSSEKNKETRSKSESGVLLFACLAVLNGASCAVQTAVNGKLSLVTGSIIKTTLISLSVALVCTIIMILAISAAKGRESIFVDGNPPERFHFHWAMIVGGALAFVIVGGNAYAGSVLGTGIATIMIMVGAMATGLVIDATGCLGIEKKPVTAKKLAGMALLIAGAALISLF